MLRTDPIDLQRVQLLRKGALAFAVALALAVASVTRSFAPEACVHETIESVGIVALVLCIVGRAWCSLYIGGRKSAEVVTDGPYSMSRNPLYVFSFLGAFGMGAQTGSLTLACLFAGLTTLVFMATVQKEEAWLTQAFGVTYRAYQAKTPRFWPNLSGWKDRDVLEVQPRFFVRTVGDGLIMLVAVPLFGLMGHAQDEGWLRVLLLLP